jgi:hypothetical protein
MDTDFRATLMAADTGGSEVYRFRADTALFRLPADAIVRKFMQHMNEWVDWKHPPAYELYSAVRKDEKQVVMATGALRLGADELPFLLLISPERRAAAPAGEAALPG